ncbi:AzlD domain-containing protein [Polynucleobacter sp.]|uniref:AzlD domain-containing protein n=1 Tax=Polynucleobacter sp. TaxID=2029855 RepID=UPI00258798B0|nr:AzlD domain-containing protein [Polynucleobacter sp.]MCX7237230.1 AzlD domain-containing protein [Polynucleobacter sp.]
MSEIYLWIAFFGLMLVTIITRSFFLLGGSRFDIPETIHEFLRYAPTAALIAIVLPEVLFIKDPASQLFQIDIYSPHLFGGVVAVIGYLITKNMLGTIFLGMVAFTAARFLL